VLKTQPVASQDFIEQLLVLPDVAAQKRFLERDVRMLDDGIADALKGQADQLLRSDIHRSLQTAGLLLHLAELTGNPLHRALGLLAEANARSIGGLGEYARAVELYDEAAAIYKAHNRLVDQANAQIGKVFSLAILGRYDEALEAGQWASEVLEEHGKLHRLATLKLNLAVVHGRQREDSKALAMFNHARELYHQLGAAGEKQLPLVEGNRAIVLRNLGQFRASIKASETACEIAARLDQKSQISRAQQELAYTYLVLGRYNEALELLDRARDVMMSDGRPSDTIEVELVICNCLLQLRRFNDALETCRQIRARFRAYGRYREVAEVTLHEAAAYAGLQRYDDALASLVEARHLFEKEGTRLWIARTDLETAAVLHHRGQFEETLATAQACAGVFQEHDLPFQEAQACLVAARAAAALDRHDLAYRLVNKALAVGEAKDVPALTYECRHLLGALAEARGDPHWALSEYDRAIEQLERLRGRMMVEFRAGFLEDKQVVYEDVVGLCLDLDRSLQGLEYAERAKSRTLLDMLAYRVDLSIQARSSEDAPLVEELMRLRSERDRLYRRWEGDKELKMKGWPATNGNRQLAQHEVLALEKRIEDLWHRLLIRNADYARDAALWQVRTEPVQPYLSADTLLLEYFTVHGELAAFLITTDTAQAVRLSVDLARVRHLLQLLWLNLRATSRSDPSRITSLTKNAQGLLQHLYTALLSPLADTLTLYPKLIIVPHGPLHYLPFHALHDGETFLLEHHEIAYLPGASFSRYVTEARSSPSGFFALGHSYGGMLPYAVQEAQSIAALLGGRAVVEQEATLARLLEGSQDCRILHVAAHGDFRPDNPLFSGLALADGWLTTLDIFNLRLQASLVTLSACRTGQSVVGGGDELLGLMRAFLYAGAASLVLSQWAVEDRSTAQIMETFYEKLAQGSTKGAALRYAQLQFIRGAGTDLEGEWWAHPYFWAPFFLVGDTGSL
jgi:CHAT domain-containing protein